MTTEDWKGEHFIRDVPRSNPQSDAAKFGNAKRSHGQRRDIIARVMKPRPLTKLQQDVFDAIRHAQGVSSAEVALALGMLPRRCIGAISELRRKQLVAHDNGRPAKWWSLK
jgi:hypothetical protein